MQNTKSAAMPLPARYVLTPLVGAQNLSRIRTLTSKITQVCQDICDIKLRQLLITRSDEEPNNITNSTLTNQSDCKDTWGSYKTRPETLDIHEGHAEGDNDYAYKTSNHHELSNQDSLQCRDTYLPQRLPKPSGMTPKPLPFPNPSEASETSSSLPASLSSPPKKDNNKPVALLMYTKSPFLSWALCLAPTKKNGRVEPAEELEMREGAGLMRGGASPCLEFCKG